MSIERYLQNTGEEFSKTTSHGRSEKYMGSRERSGVESDTRKK